MWNQQCKGIYLCIIFFIFVTNVKTYGVNPTHININNKTHNISSNIATEGGTIKLTPNYRIPENTITFPLISNTSTESSINTTINQKLKVITHEREGITHPPILSNVTSNVTVKNITITEKPIEKIIPVSEEQPTTKTTIYMKPNVSSTETPTEHTGESKIKPRKGAPTDSPEITETTTKLINTTKITNTTKPTEKSTVKPHKMKPTVTIGSDDEPFPPSNFVPHSQKTEHNNSLDGKLKNEYINGKYFKKSPDYVLPIVLTILAVPLVAILITVLYKRSSEWWQHRHYRRMDFLIDGMYNN